MKFVILGKFYNLTLKEVHQKCLSTFGSIVKFPTLFGIEGVVTVFDPNDIEKVFRTEGVYPNRRAFDTLKYYRNKFRPEIYSEVGGLISEY